MKVDIRGPNGPNDLTSCLSSQIGLDRHLPPSIVSASTVVAFELVRAGQGSLVGSQAGQAPTAPFKYPVHVYLDQFLRDNSAITNQKRLAGSQMREKLQGLLSKKKLLLEFEVCFSFMHLI